MTPAGEGSRRRGLARRRRLEAVALAAVLVAGCAAPWSSQAPRPRLMLAHPAGVRVGDPVTIVFDRPVTPGRLRVDVRPAAAVVISRQASRVVITPIDAWRPGERYTLTLTGATPAAWRTTFRTQPRVAAEFRVDGQAVSGSARVTARSRLEVAFTTPMWPPSVAITLGGRPVPAAALYWSPDASSLSVPLTGVLPYSPVELDVGPGAVSAAREPMTEPGGIELTMQATLPSNVTSGIGPGFRPLMPMELVVENSGPARPQAGLQQADVVYEYVSEYEITRMTAIYFNHVPDLVGPLRSCRMINAYLAYAYVGAAMCTGASNGTLHWILASDGEGQPVLTVMEPFDHGGHFFRVGYRAVPHNAYTSGDRVERVRTEIPQPYGEFAVDPPHADVDAGQPAGPPSVPPHAVTYGYDEGSRQYLRFDHGAPFTDQVTGAQLSVKNVILLHVPSRDAGWVEDENGGAHSVWYDMLGSGPAEVYSDGRMVSATWHMGSAVGQWYYDNHTPVWFTDAAGQPLLLNTGLTWIHVIGSGQ